MRMLILAIGIAAIASSPSLAMGPGKGPKGPKGHGAAVSSCPPGLAAKGCMPPGQAKKLYGTGQRLPSGFRYVVVPEQYRNQIRYDDRYRYYYDEDQVYVVDPATRLIQDVIRLVL